MILSIARNIFTSLSKLNLLGEKRYDFIYLKPILFPINIEGFFKKAFL